MKEGPQSSFWCYVDGLNLGTDLVLHHFFNVTPVRVRASLTSEFIEKSVQYVWMHTIFDTRVELLPVVEVHLWYWQVPAQFWTVLIKVQVWKTFFTEPFATCSCIHRVGQGPRFPFCSVNGASLLRFVFPQIPWLLVF